MGGRNAAATIKAKYGADFYKNIGSKGGTKSKTGGFYANRELARVAGAVGGSKSRRGVGKTQVMLKEMAIGESKEIPIPSTVKSLRFPARFYVAASRCGVKITVSSRTGNSIIVTRLG